MNAAVRARSGLRAAVNARLEEISFRTGLITAAVALGGLLVIAAAGVYVAVPGQAPAGRLSAGSTQITHLAAPVSAASNTVPQPRPSATHKAQQPVTAATTSAQPGAGAQPQAGAGSWEPPGHRFRSRGYAGISTDGYGPWYGGYGSWHGGSGMPGSRGSGGRH